MVHAAAPNRELYISLAGVYTQFSLQARSESVKFQCHWVKLTTSFPPVVTHWAGVNAQNYFLGYLRERARRLAPGCSTVVKGHLLCLSSHKGEGGIVFISAALWRRQEIPQHPRPMAQSPYNICAPSARSSLSTQVLTTAISTSRLPQEMTTRVSSGLSSTKNTLLAFGNRFFYTQLEICLDAARVRHGSGELFDVSPGLCVLTQWLHSLSGSRLKMLLEEVKGNFKRY